MKGRPRKAGKPRVRLNSRGWFYHAYDFLHGVKDFYTGTLLPDAFGRVGLGEVWVGPYASFEAVARDAIRGGKL